MKNAKKIMYVLIAIAMLVTVMAVPALAKNGNGNGQGQGHGQGLRDGSCVFLVDGVEVICPNNGVGVGTGIGNGGAPKGCGGARLQDGSGGNLNCPFLP